MLLPDLSPLIHGLEKGKRVEVLLEHMRSPPQLRNRRPQNAMTPNKKPNAVANFYMKFSRRVKNTTPGATSSPVAPVT
jgi:hypothetical protein